MTPVTTPYLAEPSGTSPLLAAIGWIENAALGTVASIIAVLCVATIGLLMLRGRVDIRHGATVILGCFVLFGAPTIVTGFLSVIGRAPPGPETGDAEIAQTAPAPPPPPLSEPDQDYDPYAGASLIRRR